ncbi:MAG: EcsC family protein [Peptococcaceae bacterium]|nr:EcsC family protein [Peptococcaceae bacterium]
MFFRVNPFDFVNEAEAGRRVARLKKARPEMTRRQLCDVVIAGKSRWCAFSGAVTALPGNYPGLGTLLALLGGAAVDIMALMYFMSEMIMELALIYDRDFRRQATAREAVWVFMSAAGTDAVSKNISKFAVKQMGRQAFIKFTQDLLITLGIRISQRSVLKIIPFLGAMVSGLVNYLMCRKVGKMVADYYESSSPGEWGGVTIDV